MNLIKRWWFWIIIIIIIFIITAIIINIKNKNERERSFSNIGKGINEYIEGINNAKSHIDDFSYNYETEQVEYKPSIITINMYNKIKEGMTEKEVIDILGKYDKKLEPEDADTYLVHWGSSDMKKGYWISIVFYKNNTVLSKSQLGLK